MKSARRFTLQAILAAGDIFAHEDGGTGTGTTGDGGAGTGQDGSAGGAGQNDQSGTEGKTGGTGDDLDKLSPEDLLKKAKALKDEQERHYTGKKSAEQKLVAAEAERDELKKAQEEVDRKGKTELENAKADVEKLNQTVADKDQTIKRLTVENAFLQLKDIEWHNPQRALKLVDLSDVEFDEKTGSVKDPAKLVAAAKDLAKTDSYLVRSKTSVSEGTPTGRPSGQAPAGGKNGAVPSDAEIKNKWNLNNR